MSKFTDGLLRKLAGRKKPKRKKRKPKLTAERLRQVLSYCPDSGEFRWLVRLSYRGQVGEIAGALNGPVYRRIGVDGGNYSAAKLAIFWMEGRYPKYEVRHADGNPQNLAWENLKPRPKAPRRRRAGSPSHSPSHEAVAE
jgi:hypothetical protein